MSNMMLGFPNYIDSCNLSGGSWQATLPQSRIKDRVLGHVARTTDATTANTYMVVDITKSRKIRTLAAINHNMSVDAKFRVRAANEGSTKNYLKGTENPYAWSSTFPSYGATLLGYNLFDITRNGASGDSPNVSGDALLANTAYVASMVVDIAATNDAADLIYMSLFGFTAAGNGYAQIAFSKSNKTVTPTTSGPCSVVSYGAKLISGTIYRIWVSGNFSSAVNQSRIYAYTANDLKKIRVGWLQIETGSTPTSYWPTPPTFSSRASSATYYDSTGTMQTAAANVARISYDPNNLSAPPFLMVEAAATNYVKGSEQFTNPAWIQNGSNSIVVVDAAGVGPFPNTVCAQITFGGAFAIWQQSTGFPVGATCSASIWVKGNAGETISMAAGGVDQVFTFTGSWQQLKNENKVAVTDSFNLSTFNGVTARSFLIACAQLEAGTRCTSYFPTPPVFVSRASSGTYYDNAGILRTALTNISRTTYDPSNLSLPPQLLIEATGSNYCTYSEQFDQWPSKFQTTVIPDAAIAPNNTMTADKVVNAGATEQSIKSGNVNFTMGTYIITVYAKAAEVSAFQIPITSIVTGWGTTASFDLVAVTATSGGPCFAAIKSVGGGWYRCSVIFSCYYAAVTASAIWINLAMTANDPTKGMYFWGAQLEAVSPKIFGQEQISNGNFASGSTGWTVGSGWSVSGGVATKTTSTSGNLTSTASSIVGGKTYQVSFTATGVTTNNFKIDVSTPGDNFQSDYFGVNGSNVVTFTSNVSGQFSLFGFSAGATVTNISVKEVVNIQPSSYIATVAATVTRSADVVSYSQNRAADVVTYSQTRPAGYFDSQQSYDYDSGLLDVWPVVYDYMNQEWEDDNWWNGKYTDEERAGYTASLIHVTPQDVLAQYWRLEIQDTTNPSGYVQIGRVFIGPVWQPTVNLSTGANLGWGTNTDVQEAIGGAEYFQRRTPYRTAKFVINYLGVDEAFGRAFEIQRRAGIDGEVLYIHDPDDTYHALRRRFLCRLKELSPIEFPYVQNNSAAFQVKELL